MSEENQQNQENGGAEQGENLKTENLEALAGEYEAANDPEPEAGPEVDVLGADELAGFAKMGFEAAAKARGDFWRISDDEAKNLGVAGDRCIRHYLGNAKMSPGGALIAVAALISLPRLVTDIAMTKAKAQQAANDDGQQKGTGTDGN